MPRILHADDDEDYRNVVSDYIYNYFQIVIDSVASGNKAKEKIKEGLRYQLVISDLMMPDGDGNDLFQFVNKYSSKSCFIFLTNSPYEVRIFDSDIFYFVVEKTELRKLREKIELAICC